MVLARGMPPKLTAHYDSVSGMQSTVDSLGLYLFLDGTRIKCTRVNGDLPPPHTSIIPATLAPTAAPTLGSLHLPINATEIIKHSRLPCAIPIDTVDMQSAEAVASLIHSHEIQTALKQFVAIQLRQMPPIPEWGEPEETLNNVRDFLKHDPTCLVPMVSLQIVWTIGA